MGLTLPILKKENSLCWKLTIFKTIYIYSLNIPINLICQNTRGKIYLNRFLLLVVWGIVMFIQDQYAILIS